VQCVGISAYKIDDEPDQMRYEIMKNGPVEAEFIVYEDFLSYKSGTVQCTSYSLFLKFLFTIFDIHILHLDVIARPFKQFLADHT